MSVVQAVHTARSRVKPRSVAREVVLHISCFIAGGIVSRGATLGELSPFGASLVAAVPFSYMPAGMLGAALSYLLSSPLSTFRYIAVVIAIGAIRWVLNDIKKISESRLFAPAIAFIPVFATGIALTLSSQSEMTEVYEGVIEAVIAAAGAYFISRTAILFESRRALSGLPSRSFPAFL